MKTRYSAAACRSMTCAGVRPVNAATASRSGPNSPPYATGTSTCRPARTSPGDAAARSSAARTAAASAMSGSKYTATERNVDTTSRTPRIPSARTTAAMAIACALTCASMTASSSSSRAESPASLTAGTIVRVAGSMFQGVQELAMDAAEAAVRHQHDNVPLAMLPDDRADDLVVVRQVTRAPALGAKVVDEAPGVEPLGVGQRRAEDRCDDDFVGADKSPGKIILKHATARRGGARLEDRPDTAFRVTVPQRRKRFVHRGRMVRKIVENRHPMRDADRFEPALDAGERAEALSKLRRREAERRADRHRRKRVPHVVHAEQRRLENSERLAATAHRKARPAVP